MEVVVLDEAKKQLKKLPKSELRKVVAKLEHLANNPKAGKQLNGNLVSFRSLRAWPYRIIYRIEGSELIIFSIAHRQGVYKR